VLLFKISFPLSFLILTVSPSLVSWYVTISRALCDLRASVSLMPLSICEKLQMCDLKPTTISL